MFKNWVTDPEVSRYWCWEPHADINETKAVLAEWIKDYEKQDTYHWIIVFKSIAQAIGYIYLNEINNANASASVHFALSRKFWNMGIMTEACKGVLDFAFTKLLCNEINSYHHIDNIASGQVMKKCGMRYVNTEYRQIPDYENISGDYSYYKITVDNWKYLI
jgi:ribosomal-protein-alanine N-acetyltransferase